MNPTKRWEPRPASRPADRPDAAAWNARVERCPRWALRLSAVLVTALLWLCICLLAYGGCVLALGALEAAGPLRAGSGLRAFIGAAGIAASYALALAGEPQSVWWWRDVLGVVKP